MRFWIIPAGAIHWYVMHLYYKYCSILHTYKPSKSVSDTFVDFLKIFLHQATIGKILSIFWQTILLHKTIVKTNRTPILDYNWKSFFYLIIFNNMVDKIAELEWFEIYRGISVSQVKKSRNLTLLGQFLALSHFLHWTSDACLVYSSNFFQLHFFAMQCIIQYPNLLLILMLNLNSND